MKKTRANVKVSFGGVSDTQQIYAGYQALINKFLRRVIPLGTTFVFEYLGEFANDLEKNLGNDSGVHLVSIRERHRG
jgi:hypothetical protein